MRKRSLLCAITAAAGLTLTGVAAPAYATTSSVTSLTELNAALADCTAAPNQVTIAADISALTAVLAVGCATTIDLNHHNLSVRSVTIATGSELVVSDSSPSSDGILTADASTTQLAGIRTTGATLRVTSGVVRTIGGVYGAGIGGDTNGASGGTLIVEGGSVSAVGTAAYGSAIGGASGSTNAGGNGGIVTVTGGSLTASSAGGYTTTIGGGDGAPGGTGATISVTGGSLTAASTGVYATTTGGGGTYDNVTGPGGQMTIGPAGTVTLSSVNNIYASVFGPGIAVGGAVGTGAPGTVVVDGTLILQTGTLRLPAGTSATVGATGLIRGTAANPTSSASVVGPGTITNNGTVALTAPTQQITGNNRLLTFDTGSTTSLRVYGPTLDAGYRSLPAAPTDTAWNTAANGTGTWFSGTDSTSGTGTTALFAAGPGSLQLSTDPADFTATAGELYEFPVTVLDSLGAVVSPQPAVTYATADCVMTSPGVFETAGACTISASAPWGPFTLENEFTVTVSPAAPVSLELTPSTTSVETGTPVSYLVDAVDAFGNTSPATGATLASSEPADTVTGLTVTPNTVATRTITASIPGSASVTGTATLTATVPTLLWDAPDLTTTAGDTVPLDAIVTNSAGTPFTPQPAVTYTSDCPFTGSAVFTRAGTCTVTASATFYGLPTSTEFSVEVSPAAAAALTVLPSAPSIAQGGTLTFTVTGVDEFNNPVSTAAATLTSSVATDVVNGLSVRFPHASPHTITAALGAARGAVTVEVIAPVTPATPSGTAGTLSNTGVGPLLWPLGTLALIILALGALAVTVRRRSA